MYRFFVGIDVSKDVIDTAVKETDQVEYLGQFKNDDSGFKKMLKELIKVTSCKSTQGFFCFENTGIYSKSLLEFLISQQIPCREENPIQIKRSMGLKPTPSSKYKGNRAFITDGPCISSVSGPTCPVSPAVPGALTRTGLRT